MEMSLNKNIKEPVRSECANIADIFRQAMTRYPQRPALVLPDKTLSYGELWNLVASVALRLKAFIHATGNRIAIVGGNHLAYIVAYWGAQCLGASTIEIDRNESIETLLNAINETHARVVVTDRNDLKSALHGKIPVKLFDEFLAGCEKPNESGNLIEIPQIADDSEASIVYTSGTTASAKGVVLSQRNFCFIAHSVADYLDLDEEDRCALVLPLCHTYGKSVMLSAAAAGAAVVMLNGFSRQEDFLQLSAKKCTMLSVVPYHLHLLVKSGSLSKYDFSSLRTITSSANKLSPDVIDCLTVALPQSRIFSMYGLTEATTRACYVPPEFLPIKKESCGRPIAGVEIKIAPESGISVSLGGVGEILLRGPNIMKGYWEDSKLTADTIVDGWLKTGDIGHLDDDGFLYIDGRKKDIIKCAGERINPWEIEEVLREHPGVDEAAVVGCRDSLMGEILHAYVTPRVPSLKISALRDHCCARLYRHKIPYRYSIVTNLPKTTTGKIQKHLLTKG
jgi:acyl-CoA synthetase (AMP-forming)/AMP-acid ligase II